MTQTAEDFELFHYGVKGMKWGRSKTGSDGISRKTNREAKRDAAEFTKAKMFYGEGAGTRRKLIKNTVEAKSKKDPKYKEAFDKHAADTDMSKRAEQARSTRKRTDVVNSGKKTAKGVVHVVRGNKQYANIAAITLATGATVAWKAGGDKLVKKHGPKLMNDIKNEANLVRTKRMMRDMGF